jgi:hypothetical protein
MIGTSEQVTGAGDAAAEDELDDGGSDFSLEKAHQAARGKTCGLGNHREGEVFGEVNFDKGDRPAQLHPGLARFGEEALFVGMGQAVGNKFQQIEEIVLPVGGKNAILTEQFAQGIRGDAGLDQILAGDTPLGRGGLAVVHLAALKQGDRFAVAYDRDNKLAESGMAAIPQRQPAASGLEELALVAHGAQGAAGGIPLESGTKGLGALFWLEDDHALSIGRNQGGVDLEEPPGDIQEAGQASHGRDLVERFHAIGGKAREGQRF